MSRRLPALILSLAVFAVVGAADQPAVKRTDEVREPGLPFATTVMVENTAATAVTVSATWTLQANPLYIDQAIPDPQLGIDHALGARCTLMVDGADRGDPLLCDGDDTSGYQTPWGKVGEAVATIDLGTSRPISAVRWIAGDANWIFQADVSTSIDGSTWTPVAGAQGVAMKGKWGGPHALPWSVPVSARHLRLRFHNGGAKVDNLRLPTTIQVYDGVANDTIAVPNVGPVIARGTTNATIPPKETAGLALTGSEQLKTGAYLLGLDLTIAGRREVRWSHVFVLPSDQVPAGRARRFGVNASQAELAASMRRCGFGWVRFENAKWMMFMPKADHAAFDGSVGPWHVNLDGIFDTYRSNDINVLPYVFQTPEYATSAPANVKQNRSGWPPKNPADYGEAVFQLVARFGSQKVEATQLKSSDKKSGLGLMQAVELWNEPNLTAASWGPFVGPITQYFDVLRAGIEGSRRADPKLPVSAAGWAGIDLEIVAQLAEHKYADGKTPLDLIDIINVHFYSGREEPEICGWDPNVDRNGPSHRGDTYPEQLEALVAWRDLHKPGAEIWLTEIGNDVGGPMGRSERHQAAKVPRGIMLALAAGIERVFIYREKGSDPAQHAGAGLLRNDGSIRPVWLTTATMIRQLQGIDGRAVRLPHADPNVWAFLWQDGERRVVSAWTLGTDTKLGLDLGSAAVCDAFGHVSTGNAADVMLGYAPTYLTLSSATPTLTRLISEGKARDATRTAERVRLDKVVTRAFDFGTTEHVGVLKGLGLPRRFTAIGKDTLWSDSAGFGFLQPAAQVEDTHWIGSALDRDGVKVAKDAVFRIRVPAGRQRVKLSATPMGDGNLTATIADQKLTITKQQTTAEVVIDGGKDLDLALGDWGILRWLTVVPEKP
ncbi:MAG: discoidin domain-containing protein [Planctomycetes bacterium]|nr:discoidin domain-containing protein [Planctomycetota bacterium]